MAGSGCRRSEVQSNTDNAKKLVNSHTYNELRRRCRAFGLSTCGTKRELARQLADAYSAEPRSASAGTEDDAFFAVDDVIKARNMGDQTEVLVVWKGCAEEDATWEPEENLENVMLHRKNVPYRVGSLSEPVPQVGVGLSLPLDHPAVKQNILGTTGREKDLPICSDANLSTSVAIQQPKGSSVGYIMLAAMSGLCAAAAAAAGKLLFGDAPQLRHSPLGVISASVLGHGSDSGVRVNVGEERLLTLLYFEAGAMFLGFNALMYVLFSVALAKAPSAMEPTGINTAFNFIGIGLLGMGVFGEQLSPEWWVGSFLMCIGVLLVQPPP